MIRWIFSIGSAVLFTSAAMSPHGVSAQGRNWESYYGSRGNDHFSELKQIDRTNVSRLREAWRFDTREAGGLETTPLIVDGVVYAVTPSQKVIALDGRTGRLVWTFDAHAGSMAAKRGLTYWQEGRERRIFIGIKNRLYCLDPSTGELVKSFGGSGYVDLREHMGRDASAQSIGLSSPGVIYRDLIVVGSQVAETLPAPPGDIRAYDVRTGALRWSFHTIPHPGEAGYATWPAGSWRHGGAANNWAGMAVDTAHGIVYVPTGSAAPDFYGGGRVGDNLYANSLIALEAKAGKRLWHFQGVHHDLWDRDFPSPPTLLTVRRNGREIPAVAESSKQGLLFVFDRLTGKPLFPIEERPVAASDVPGEKASRTQPIPLLPEPFARQEITEKMLTERTPEAHAWALAEFRKMRHGPAYDPFRVGEETLVMPSFEGGGEWGGMAADPRTGVLFINANDYASVSGLAAHRSSTSGRSFYLNQCGQCHGADRAGSPPMFPSLRAIGERLSDEQITGLLHEGRGRMPAFPNVQGDSLKRLLDYLHTGEEDSEGSGEHDRADVDAKSGEEGLQYTMTGYKRFLDPDGYPAVAPPWGTLSAIDLNTGKYLWKRPLGEYPALAAKGMKDTGTENYGGPLVTAGGVVFIAATNFDRKFRALDERTGELLWETQLPFAGNATPATYEVDGQQYVVIAAGGDRLMVAKDALGGVYVAYALPKEKR